MAFRPGDASVTFEGRIVHKSAKSYLVEATLGGRWFVPFSQIAGGEYGNGVGEPDIDGNRVFEVSEWWWDRKNEVPE